MTKTTTKKQPSAQVEPAQKASALKVANEAKRAQPDWLCRRSLSPPRETETPSAPERLRTSDRSQGPPWLLDRHQVCAFHLLEAKHLPATKVGRTWTSTRSRLRRFFEGDAS